MKLGSILHAHGKNYILITQTWIWHGSQNHYKNNDDNVTYEIKIENVAGAL